MRPLQELLSLKGVSSLITGAASGIGEATAYRFAEAGSDLYLVDIDFEGLLRVKKFLTNNYNINVDVFRLDLGLKNEIDELWKELRGNEPGVLVNNAGVYVFKDFLRVDEPFLRKTLAVNLESMLWMCQHMIKSRMGLGGSIINVSSIEAILPFTKGLVHYDVSKIGVIGLTRSLAREYGKNGFRINAVVPGGIETPGVKKIKREAILKLRVGLVKAGTAFKNRLPIGRMGTPDEVARIILALATDLGSYVNGAIIPVDGGFLSA